MTLSKDMGIAIAGAVAGALSHLSVTATLTTLLLASAVGIILMLAVKPQREQQAISN